MSFHQPTRPTGSSSRQASFSPAFPALWFRLQLEEKTTLFVILTAISTLITTILKLVPAVAMRQEGWGFVLSNIAGQGITFLLFLFSAARRLPIPRLDLVAHYTTTATRYLSKRLYDRLGRLLYHPTTINVVVRKGGVLVP